MATKSRLKAIDLYGGVGGWALGLKLAGIEVVSSYDIWQPANLTNAANLRGTVQRVDVRKLNLKDLPKGIDVVVGSPPCTQFSLSNRGGNGDMKEGLEDVAAFLRVVDHLRPKFWAMENVPRFAGVFVEASKGRGKLAKFRHLTFDMAVFRMDEFGLPQRRQRCIVGNFDFERLRSYKRATEPCTLGRVITSLGKKQPVDPVYGSLLEKADLLDHNAEDRLSDEETRINRAAKTMHPVYNSMPFPDPLTRSARTITATCTRVSRESIVVPAKGGGFRRLTVRERASLQGFPATFQFYGRSHGAKMKMVGNAMPPPFARLIAEAMLGTAVSRVKSLTSAISKFCPPTERPPQTSVDRAGRSYRKDRNFCFAIPSLRLKSGVRFELHNQAARGGNEWGLRFVFGTSKDIQHIAVGPALSSHLNGALPKPLKLRVVKAQNELRKALRGLDLVSLQQVWNRRGEGNTHPFDLLDLLDGSGAALQQQLASDQKLAEEIVSEVLRIQFGKKAMMLPGRSKLLKNSVLVLSGLLVSSAAQDVLPQTTKARAAR